MLAPAESRLPPIWTSGVGKRQVLTLCLLGRFTEGILKLSCLTLNSHVQATYADIDELVRDTGFKPVTTLEYGIGKWVEWYRGYKAEVNG